MWGCVVWCLVLYQTLVFCLCHHVISPPSTCQFPKFVTLTCQLSDFPQLSLIILFSFLWYIFWSCPHILAGSLFVFNLLLRFPCHLLFVSRVFVCLIATTAFCFTFNKHFYFFGKQTSVRSCFYSCIKL